MAFSGVLQLTDLNDFITPSQVNTKRLFEIVITIMWKTMQKANLPTVISKKRLNYVSVSDVSAPRRFGRYLSFFLYILPGARFRALSAGVHCTLRVAGWKPTSNHIEITVGFFNLHRGWLSLHRGHPVNVPIRRTMHLSSVIPANDTRESVFGHRNFSRRERESNLGPLAPEASA